MLHSPTSKAIFGPCQKAEGVKGGAFFHCAWGLTLGCDAEETGSFVQIRTRQQVLEPRSFDAALQVEKADGLREKYRFARF